jgi:ubiquinone/menaquinone biosynthesis C-methylase UbiE
MAIKNAVSDEAFLVTNRNLATHLFSDPSGRCKQSESLGSMDTPAARSDPPSYLLRWYWWAYAHPISVRVFEREWLINAILFGNYDRLRSATIEALGPDYSGRTLQMACAYGSFTPELAQRVGAAGGSLDVIDALPVQIDNVRRKAAKHSCVRATLMDAAALDFPECTFDRVAMFMLLHEQPEEWRRHTIAEAARVLKPGGRLVVTDYARPDWRHPLRYLLPPMLALLEPFALALWQRPIESFFSEAPMRFAAPHRTFFGGLYQLVMLERV